MPRRCPDLLRHRTGLRAHRRARLPLAPVDIISIEAAVGRLDRFRPLDAAEQVTLADAVGRILAEDVAAPNPVPAHPSSAMDGYAVRAGDVAAGATLPVQGRSAARRPLGEPLRRGHAVRIFTGAVLPDGADTV